MHESAAVATTAAAAAATTIMTAAATGRGRTMSMNTSNRIIYI